MKKRRKSLRFLTMSAVMAAVLAILSPFTLPIGPVPVTLATFALFLVSATAVPLVSVSAVAIYLALGALGLPVFSGFTGGVSAFAGVTGGFLWGYLPAALIVSLFAKAGRGRKLFVPLGMTAAIGVIYALGCVWFTVVADCSFGEAILSAVLPFLLPDAVKIAAASAVSLLIRRRFSFAL